MAFLMDTDRDMSPAKDLDDMEALMTEFREVGWTDRDGHPICDEVLAACLRRGSFDVGLALDYLVAAGDQYAQQVPFTSTPGQEKHALLLLRGEARPLARTDPASLPVQIEALRALGLQDEKRRPFCDEVLAAALRTTFYDVNLSAELLVELTGQSASWDGCRPPPEREDALAQLKLVFPGLSESRVAAGYDDAGQCWPEAVCALVEVESQPDV
jgi:hypothetical protein